MKRVSDLISGGEAERVGSIRESAEIIGDAVFDSRQTNGKAGRATVEGHSARFNLSTRLPFRLTLDRRS